MNDEDGCGRDQEAGTAPESSDKVAAESSGNAASNLVIRFDSQSSNEPLWTESDFEDYMKRCKKDWSDEEQEELMESLKTLHELKEWWKNVDKSGEENPRVPMRSRLGSQNLRVRISTPRCSRTRLGTQSWRKSWNKR